MAKRFIDTELFNDEWFVDLPNDYKLLWIYIITNCNQAGILKVSYKLLNFYIGKSLEPSEVKRVLRGRIVEIDEGRKWFIPKFIGYQYGTELSPSNPAVKNVIKLLKNNDLLQYLEDIKIKGLQRSLEGASKELGRGLEAPQEKDKDMDKEKDKDKEEEKEKEQDKDEVQEIWIATWGRNPKQPEREETERLIDQFGKEKTKRIFKEAVLNGFHKIKTLIEALDAEGNIRPRDARSNGPPPDIASESEMIRLTENLDVKSKKEFYEGYKYDERRRKYIRKREAIAIGN